LLLSVRRHALPLTEPEVEVAVIKIDRLNGIPQQGEKVHREREQYGIERSVLRHRRRCSWGFVAAVAASPELPTAAWARLAGLRLA
jgi:hypothetical protein